MAAGLQSVLKVEVRAADRILGPLISGQESLILYFIVLWQKVLPKSWDNLNFFLSHLPRYVCLDTQGNAVYLYSLKPYFYGIDCAGLIRLPHMR